MKRFTMIVALLLLVAMPMMAERVTPETARKVATTFLNNNGAKTAQLTDLSKTAGFSNLYIFNSEQGFVVMAADDCVQPILGYSLTGEFVAEDMPSNVSGWLQGYNDEIQYAIDSKMSATTETAKMWKDLAEGNSKAGKATTVVAPLIQTKWSQNQYYNALCPVVSDGPDGHAYTGCVATAMAQIMKYWGYPANGIGSHSYTWNNQTLSANFGATTYDWNNMANYYQAYYATGTDQYGISVSNTQEQITAVATLMYHCGVSVEMIYGGNSTGGSAASSSVAANALKNYFNYSSNIEHKSKDNFDNAVWIQMVKDELNAQRPLEYSGRSGTGSNSTGHSFVCDGYDNADYFHFNWGWWGRYDGYFSLSNLNTGANSSQPGAGNGDYTYVQSAIFGIQPASMIAAPTNLTYTLSGLQNITLTWNAANGASSYNVYCDGSIIGNTMATTYSETAPFGTHDYYVRAVDSNSQMSLPSNTVTVTIAYPTPIVDDLTASLSNDNITLSWTAPEWCYPETPSATLTYGSGEYSGSAIGYNNGSNMYWGHRHLAENLNSYDNMVMYKAAFYANEAGAYKIFVYKGTNSNRPQTKVLEQSINVDAVGWFEFDLSSNIIIDSSYDYWIFMYDPLGRGYPATYCSYSGSYADYYASAPTSWVGTVGNAAFLIKTYVTDGTYTYNLYDNSTTVATNLATTQYTVSNPSNNTAHRYTVKTNYYGGETEASNMVGFALGNAALTTLSLGANDHMTVTEGSKLTVSGTISNSNAANLVLENGAQLSSSPVTGTMLKNINGYTDVHNDHEGYYLISSPVAGISPVNVTNMVSDTFDLYAFDATENQYWRNYKAQGNFTTLDQGIGYLYANADTTTLVFADTLNASFIAVNNLNYDANSTLHSLNLVGNPYAYQAEFNIADTYNGGWVSAPNCLTLNAAGDGFVVKPLVGDEIVLAPMEAVLVQATDYDESFTEHSDISPIGDGGEIKLAPGLINLSVSQDLGDVIDNAIVRFNGGSMLGKLRLNTHATELYIPQGGKDYSVVCAENEGTVPVNFKARQNGTYTLSIENQNLELSYLHLIDNMTGAEVDLLATPSYTFEATTDDHAYRFTLVLDESASDDATETAFAYYNGSEWVIDNIGKSTMEIVDMTGRIVVAKTIAGRQTEVLNVSSGIYVVRLNNGKTVKTQKIVVQ